MHQAYDRIEFNVNANAENSSSTTSKPEVDRFCDFNKHNVVAANNKAESQRLVSWHLTSTRLLESANSNALRPEKQSKTWGRSAMIRQGIHNKENWEGIQILA